MKRLALFGGDKFYPAGGLDAHAGGARPARAGENLRVAWSEAMTRAAALLALLALAGCAP